MEGLAERDAAGSAIAHIRQVGTEVGFRPAGLAEVAAKAILRSLAGRAAERGADGGLITVVAKVCSQASLFS